MATVLVVDDSMVMRKVIMQFIEKHTDHTVVAEASHGEDACHKYRYFRPELVTMDITMPVMDGVTATRQIVREFPDARIVVISALGQREMVIEAIKSGAKNFMVKPITGQKLLEIFTQVLDSEP